VQLRRLRSGSPIPGWPDRATTETLADLRRQYVDLQAREERITRASRRLQAEIVNFKAARESVQAAYTAAEVAANAAWAEMTAPWL
jgi:phage shock protein A